MAWLARSIANSLRLDNDDGGGGGEGRGDNSTHITNAAAKESLLKQNSQLQDDEHHEIDSQSSSQSSPSSSTATPKGVKEDLSEITKTISRQFWGVASYLAPPPEPSLSSSISDPNSPKSWNQTEMNESDDEKVSDEAMIAGIRSDIAEISGKFKTGISKLSNNIAVSEISKFASTFLQLGSEEEDLEKFKVDGVIGVTEEVVVFASNIAMYPKTWMDFPMPDSEKFDVFHMSDVQHEHALAVEHLVPRLAALRIELCPGYMTEGCFWKIYFVLVHPKLNKHDAELLSTPQIVEAREMLMMEELQSRDKGKLERDLSGIGASYAKETAVLPHEEHLSVQSIVLSESGPLRAFSTEATSFTVVPDIETEKHPVQSTEIQTIDKSIVKNEPVKETKHQHSPSGSSPVQSTENQIIDNSIVEKESVIETKHQHSPSGSSPVQSTKNRIIDKSIVEKEPVKETKQHHSPSGSSPNVWDEKFEDDADEWLKEEATEIVGITLPTTTHLVNDEDVSFSDLEEDDEDVPTTIKRLTSGSDSSAKNSPDWVELSRSTSDSVKDINSTGTEKVSASSPETKEANDWLDVDDIDVM